MIINTKSKQRGVGILEVLIALVVVSIGVLGLAGMQLNGMRVAKGSYNRSQAVLYAETIISQMRANAEGVALKKYNGLDSDNVNCSVKPSNYCSAYPGSTTSVPECTSVDDRTENDFFSVVCGHWSGSAGENGVKDSLPEGSLNVNCDTGCGTNDTYTISVEWVETEIIDGTDVAATKKVEMRVMP